MNLPAFESSTTDSISCAIYGMGKAGRSLFLSLQTCHVPVMACLTRFPQKLQNLPCNFLSHQTKIETQIQPFLDYLHHSKTTILFLATPDDVIEEIAQALAKTPPLPPIVAHLSGALSYHVLHPLINRSIPAQFHPLASLNGQSPIPPETLNSICTPELKTQKILSDLSRQIQLIPSPIQDGMQVFYHIAASLTGNLPIALIADSIYLMKQAGIEENLARKGLAKLLRSTAEAIEKEPIAKALTGPIARGDIGTIQNHLHTLEKLSSKKQIEFIYRLLSMQLIPLNENEKKDNN